MIRTRVRDSRSTRARPATIGRYRARTVDVLFSSDQPAATDADTVVLGVFEGEPAPLAAPPQAAELLASGEAKATPKSLALARAGQVILISSTMPADASAAAIVLPTSTMAEEEGTFTNLRGRVQRYFQASAAPGMSRPAWWIRMAINHSTSSTAMPASISEPGT